MKEKLLGKITYAEFGQYPERPFLFGLQLGFEFKDSDDANVNHVFELINKPVEVTLESNTFQDFGILTEAI